MPRNTRYEAEEGFENGRDYKNKKNKMGKSLWVILAVLVVVAVGAFYYFKFAKADNNYQAVFLNNGQVYFGKLSYARSQFPVLKDIYYLQVSQAQLQEGEQQDENAQPNINLIKLGAELHGPEDEMKINRDNILFVENLKSDSKVVEAIAQMKKEGK